jgi:hypothetical protein
MSKIVDEEKNEQMMDEIRTRVLDRYNEIQGLENLKENTKANFQALHEITSLPMSEIQNIAVEVKADYDINPLEIQKSKKIKPKDLEPFLPHPDKLTTFENLTRSQIKLKRSFTPHFFTYFFTNSALVGINASTTDYPWALFPITFWGIGLVIHFFAAVRWPKQNLKRKIKESYEDVRNVLIDNWKFFKIKRYQKESRRKPFVNGVYRLMVSEVDDQTILKYLNVVEENLQLDLSSPTELKQIVIQICAIRRKYQSKVWDK